MLNATGFVITPEELKSELTSKAGKLVLLDVREQDEFDEGHLDGCTLIPLGELAQRAENELKDKNADIVIYCAHGMRSMQGLMMLRMQGYMKTRSLEGGIENWYDLVGRPAGR